MTATPYDGAFEAVLAGIRQPARLIGEEAGVGPGFSGEPGELRVVLGFPDTYEIAISNQAIQILYHVARGVAGVGVERAYLPWVDALDEMRQAGVPLLTLESWTPVRETDLLAVTLQHEFHYSNLVEMLDLAGVPLHAEERGEDHPLVLVGGPACANFAPVSRFADAVAIGDGEEMFPEILAELVRACVDAVPRMETKRRLSLVEGVFVPGVSVRVRRRSIRSLAGAPYPALGLVPLVAGVHDRAWVEVMRGCTRGCRFCQAGMWYRPVRERPADEVLALAGKELAATGHQELAFASLSTTDYSCLREVLVGVAESHPEVNLSLPSLRVDSASVSLAWLASPTSNSVTLAPEAGSQRMRNIINKNVTEGDILAAAEEAFGGGRTTLKLYFMIGLPWETDEDVEAIADLCLRVRDLGRRALGSRGNRLQLNVSINTFIPKPFTPFQWAPMADREVIRRRQELLRTKLRRRGVRVSMPSPDKGYLEGALARGTEEMGSAIESAWRRGARFDSWTEQFKSAAWGEAFREVGPSLEEIATTPLSSEALLPWDIVDGVPDHGFLWSEWEKASQALQTGDCRWDGCEDCGACGDPPGNDLAAPSRRGASAARQEPALSRQAAPVRGAVIVPPPRSAVPPLRYVAHFSVTGRGRFLGHLDRMEAFRRAVRRAGGRLALSAGMRPKPLLTLVLPLGVGVQGLDEMCEFDLAERPPDDFADRLGADLPGHMRLLSLERYHGRRHLAARVTGASYRVSFSAVRPAEGPDASGTEAVAQTLAEGARRFHDSAEWMVEEIRTDRVRTVDVRRHVDRISLIRGDGDEWYAEFTAAVTPVGTARPENVMKALQEASGLHVAVRETFRTCIVVDREVSKGEVLERE